MREVKESMSTPDRVASLVVAAVLVITVGAIAVVGPNTALSAAAVAISESPLEIHHRALESGAHQPALPRAAAGAGVRSSVNASSATGRLMR